MTTSGSPSFFLVSFVAIAAIIAKIKREPMPMKNISILYFNFIVLLQFYCLSGSKELVNPLVVYGSPLCVNRPNSGDKT